MEAVSPVLPISADVETVYAKDQPEYAALPTFRTDKALISRWKLSEEERRHIAEGGDLFICVLHFGQPLQPILPIAAQPQQALEMMLRCEAEFS
jgi:hypothetical protein